MDIVIYQLDTVSIVSIFIIIISLIYAYYKKWTITYSLIITNFLVFIVSFLYPSVIYQLGFRPIYLSNVFFPQIYTLFTSMFVHSGILHIIGNMLVFFFIGAAFEQRVGVKNFLIIYLLAGICGSLTHSFLNLGSSIPLVGASGAIFGIMGAFAYSYPNDEVVMPIPVGFFMIIRRIKVIYAVLIFAVFETIIVFIGGQDNTAHFAHFGGLVGGVVIAALIIKRNKPIQIKKDEFGQNVLQPIYYQDRPRKVDLSRLDKYANTPELKSMLQRIKDETVPQVRDIWLEHFLEKTICPKCGKNLEHFDGKIWCEYCGFTQKY
jgi:membrane associated rhomboid family serine protease